MATISKHDKNSLKLFYLIFYKVDFASFERMKKLSINDCGHVKFICEKIITTDTTIQNCAKTTELLLLLYDYRLVIKMYYSSFD